MRLRYIKAVGTWPSGNPRLYVRKGGQYTALPDLPAHDPAFLKAYALAIAGKEQAQKPVTGTIGAALVAFMQSDVYLSVSDSTRSAWRRSVEDMRKRYGHSVLSDLRPKHVEADLSRLSGNPANQRLKVWRAVCGWWHERGLTRINCTDGVKKRRVPKSEGHEPLTADDVEAVRAKWDYGTPERLAFEIVHWTGARISEAVTLTEAMIGRDGWLTYRQQKTGNVVSVPFYAPAPEWSDPDGQRHLQAALAARKSRHIALMVTAYGKPRSQKAASAWFAALLRSAGVKGKGAHGLRKYRAILMAERGATQDQRMAWLGHETHTEATRYSKAADRRRIISGNTPAESGNSAPKAHETRGFKT